MCWEKHGVPPACSIPFKVHYCNADRICALVLMQCKLHLSQPSKYYFGFATVSILVIVLQGWKPDAAPSPPKSGLAGTATGAACLSMCCVPTACTGTATGAGPVFCCTGGTDGDTCTPATGGGVLTVSGAECSALKWRT